MTNLVHLTPLDPRLSFAPAGLRGSPLPSITVQGGSRGPPRRRRRRVRGKADAGAAPVRARSSPSTLAAAGVVVVSGGALGIDGAAHRGALEAGGRTWVVAPTGHERCFPPEHAGLFAEIARGPGAMIWPFAPALLATGRAFLARNRVLVALADAVVVVQAGSPFGGPARGVVGAQAEQAALGRPGGSRG